MPFTRRRVASLTTQQEIRMGPPWTPTNTMSLKTRQTLQLLRLEEQNSTVSQVEVDKVLGLCDDVLVSWRVSNALSPCPSVATARAFVSRILGNLRHFDGRDGGGKQHIPLTVSNEAAKVTSDDAVPSWTLPLVKLAAREPR
jgi:ribosomal protein L30/L7E